MTEQDKAVQGDNKRGFALQRVYVKDLSFETPGAPAVFREEWDANVNLQLNTGIEQVDDATYEVVLTVTVTASREERALYLVEVKQAGLFTLRGFEGDELDQLLGAYCPGVLFPYAREAVSDMVGKGSFPQLLLQPINFDALYQENRARRQAQQNPSH